MIMDDLGKLGVDMIVGIIIFTIAFVFIAQYVPQVFTIERGDINLQPIAYRTSAILIENPGYWTNGSANGTDWWNHTGESFRIGLSSGDANKISYQKIQQLNSFYNNSGNYTEVQTSFGLLVPERTYDFNISLQSFSSYSTNPDYVTHNGSPVLLIGKRIPDFVDIAKYERFVFYSVPTDVSTISSSLDTPNTKLYSYNISLPVRSFVITITDINDNETSSNPWMQVWFDSPSNPYVVDVSGENETLHTFDITDDINSDLLNTVYIKLHNVKGHLISSDAGEYMGGRVGAKLVVNIW